MTSTTEYKTKGQIIIDNDYQVCSNCIYDETIPAIKFDEQGKCNYCEMIDELKESYNTGTPEGERRFFEIIDKIKTAGKRKKYDVIVGLSGGTDSCYLVAKAIEWGLRPLAVHYDNTWNTAIATENIRKVTSKLNVDLYTHVVDNKESDDIFRSFFEANVPEIDGPTDIALAETLYRAASKYGVKYLFEGHSFMAEGVSPLSSAYVDGKYIKSVHKKFGELKMKTFPNMNFVSFMKWTVFKRIRKIRPLWYIPYNKKGAREYLEKNFDWQYYGGHHLENRMTAFNHSVYFPQKFNIDQRNNSLSAEVRAKLKTKEEALAEYASQPKLEDGLVDYFKKRLGYNDAQYEAIMKGERKTYKDYPTYKRRFERLRPLFFILAKASLVPMSFYIKYTSKSEI
ncbi:N-acetyl sugar amidotransferase [Roseivirga sp. E12]|uniref:N-acetyl sugar amidotransferase n=1 Tax=Roseivirga sp. E12 TaxID=2819237 RepID=UPI001ABC7BD6|nr:N-acetyl sugar amidotransferase [Roseivirga sp. E12]MBO3699759.1 N-acetyl sugar amidotransferase [Roseivirga sp. E12]